MGYLYTYNNEPVVNMIVKGLKA
ncbi:hypothetical protein EVA_14384, partial [gut metagenome]